MRPFDDVSAVGNWQTAKNVICPFLDRRESLEMSANCGALSRCGLASDIERRIPLDERFQAFSDGFLERLRLELRRLERGAEIVGELVKRKVIAIDQGKVRYSLPH